MMCYCINVQFQGQRVNMHFIKTIALYYHSHILHTHVYKNKSHCFMCKTVCLNRRSWQGSDNTENKAWLSVIISTLLMWRMVSGRNCLPPTPLILITVKSEILKSTTFWKSVIYFTILFHCATFFSNLILRLHVSMVHYCIKPFR